jgi:hypothetical protein
MPLIEFDKKHRILVTLLGVLFVCMVALTIHGYSITVWHDFIDQSPEKEAIFEKGRMIRSDDFMLDIPNLLAQSAHIPAFPATNRNIGAGQNMHLPLELPASGVSLLYRPFTWGFFVSPDFGLSFRWWSLVLGVFYSSFLALMIVSRNNFFSSLLLSIGLVYSPYLQYWSFHKGEIIIFGLITFVAGCCFCAARKPLQIVVYGLITGYAGAGIILSHIYPAISIIIGWFVLFAWGGFYFDLRDELQLREQRAARFTGVALALLIMLISGALFYRESAEAISLIRDTVYPGRRFSTGGGFPLWAFFSHNMGAMLSDQNGKWIENVCESASFVFGFVPLLLLVIFSQFTQRRINSPWIRMLAAYMAFIGVFTFIGFPVWLAKIAFMGMSLPERTQLGFGLANAFMLATAFSPRFDWQDVPPKTIRFAVAAWAALLLGSMFWFKWQYPLLKLGFAIPFVAITIAVSHVAFRKRNLTLLVVFLAALSFLTSVKFNPVVRGGTDFIYHNALSEKLIELHRSNAVNTPWLVMGSWQISNLPRMLGIPSLGGYHNYPHFKIWSLLDPEGRLAKQYNQSGYVTFIASPDRQPVLKTITPGNFEVFVSPVHDAFKKLGVRYFLSCNEQSHAIFRESAVFTERYRTGDFIIFERKER